jgi:hypothetical protein
MTAATGPRGRTLAVLAAVCALAVAVSGCGGSSRSSASGTTSSSTTSTSASTSTSVTAAPHYVRRTVRSGASGPRGAIRLASLGTIGTTRPVSLGTLSYRCDRASGLATARLGGRLLATESIYVESDRRRHLRSGTVNPAGNLEVAAVRTRTLVWHIIQSTEGWTLDGIVSLRFDPLGSGGASGCASVRWKSFVGVISHAGRWTAPHGWL